MDEHSLVTYECFCCDKLFSKRVFEISRGWERVIFGPGYPEIEIRGSLGIECYCSELCLETRRHDVMLDEGVPIKRPGFGPIEACAKCGGLVDTTEFHLTYIEHEYIVGVVAQTVHTRYLAVLCTRCRRYA